MFERLKKQHHNEIGTAEIIRKKRTHTNIRTYSADSFIIYIREKFLLLPILNT